MDTPVKVLVVDDEEHTRLGYAEVLRLDGYEVDTAENAKEGLVKARNVQFDVVVSDLRMPEMDGLQFIEKLREIDDLSRLVIITAFGSYKTYRDSVKAGVVHYLNKPVRARDLKDAIESALKA